MLNYDKGIRTYLFRFKYPDKMSENYKSENRFMFVVCIYIYLILSWKYNLISLGRLFKGYIYDY